LSTDTGRRERKKLETRDRIFECAVSLFASRGYESTTIEDIGECADVSRATVFNYFARKEDLVLAWFERRRAALAESLAEGPEESGTPRLHRGLRMIARLFEDDPATSRAMVRAWLRAGGPLLSPDADIEIVAHAIREGQQAGDVRPDIDVDRASLILYDAYLGALYRWVSDEEGRRSFEDELVDMLDLLLAGIAPGVSIERK
jgi:AcrR family transcriptional regulator